MTPTGDQRPRIGPLVALGWGGAFLYLVAQASLGSLSESARLGFLYQIVLLVIWSGFTPVILKLTDRLPLDRSRRLRSLAAHLAVAVSFVLFLNVAGQLITALLAGEPLDLERAWRLGRADFVQLFHLALIVYAFIAGVGYYRLAAAAHRREQLAAERLRADLAEARLLALRLQLQPHFLFNALNAIGALILTNRNDEAHDALGRLGDLLRAVLATESRALVSLREERELAEAYLALEQARLGDRLRASWDVSTEATSAMVPPLLLQLLVENAVRHGIAPRADGGEVRIRAGRADQQLRLEVWDDGAGPSPGAAGHGVGLENTRRRLDHQFGSRHRLDLERVDGWTRVSVAIPFQTELGGAAP